MNDSRKEHLLDDILAEESGPAIRDALLGQTLHLARRKRRHRKIQRATSVLAVFLGLLLLVWHFVPSPPIASPSAARPFTLVRTQPLGPSAIVETRRNSFENIITSSRTVEIIATSQASHDFRDLSDDQLLELAGPSPVILVRHGPHIAELMFSNPADREAFFRD